MPRKQVSQRTLVSVMRALRDHVSAAQRHDYSELEEPPNIGELLYEHGFPHWFVTHSRSQYGFDWGKILPAVRSTHFFFPHNTYFGRPGSNITDQRYLSQQDAALLSEGLLNRLAAFAAMLPEGEAVQRSLELDGFRVVKDPTSEGGHPKLVPFDSVTSEQEEEERVASLVRQSVLKNSTVILQHIRDARELFLQQKDHPSIGQARNFVQALLDGIGDETNSHGGHAVGYPGGTANRLNYLEQVGFFTTDEKTAVGAAWGFLCAGTHPGIPSRDEARIALILSLEFGVMLLLKFSNWKQNGFRKFS
jgi:hypothetical protein